VCQWFARLDGGLQSAALAAISGVRMFPAIGPLVFIARVVRDVRVFGLPDAGLLVSVGHAAILARVTKVVRVLSIFKLH
jgi:hypothetical protein